MSSIWQTAPNTSATKARPASRKRVFVGLSGGVDSAVSAALLKEQGYDVTGVFIRISLAGYPCTAGEDKLDAMRVAARLRIPFREIDLSDAYKKRVFELSVGEFERGRTPNPDALCNREIKFGLFFDWCIAQGAEWIATGHYAQTREGLLYMGSDPNKDQSYFLWAVPQHKLLHTLFPIGGLQKPAVRRLAKKFGLLNAERPDSQGLCFLGPISVGDMLHRELSLAQGDVLDEAGEVIGVHEGAAAYTLGQRHGFSLTAHSPDTKPHYVIAKDIEFNTITVSPHKFPAHAKTTRVQLIDSNWIGALPTGACVARYRYRQQLIPATLDGHGVLLSEPHYIPEGQSLVLYKDDRCLGGGIVDKCELA